MATITGFTAERMLDIEGSTVIDGEIVSGDLILTRHDGTTINAGPVLGPPGPTGPMGPGGGFIPGEVRLWPGGSLPELATYGTWVWADGAFYPVAAHPLAAGHIATGWRTFGGASDPGGSNFRVPDMRGLVAAGVDAMPGGARANRMTRAVAITIAGKTGEETHVISIPEMPSHSHPSAGSGQAVGNSVVMARSSGNTLGDVSFLRNTGGGTAHENVQPTVFVPYIVCLDG